MKMSMSLLSHVETQKIASEPWEFDVSQDESTLKRLADASETGLVKASVQLAVSRVGRREFSVTGQVRAEIALICQRCLDVYQHQLDIKLDEVFAEQALNVEVPDIAGVEHKIASGNEQDDYFNSEGYFRLLHYVEDEILLAVPTFPAHQEESLCNTKMIKRLHEKAEIEEEGKNPFEILKKLK